MRILGAPNPSCIIEKDKLDAELFCDRAGGLVIRGKEAYYLLVQGQWIMIILTTNNDHMEHDKN